MSPGLPGWRKAIWKQQTQILKQVCLKALRLVEWRVIWGARKPLEGRGGKRGGKKWILGNNFSTRREERREDRRKE